MSLSIQLVDSIPDLTKNINEAIATLVNRTLARNITYITEEVRKLIKPLLENQPEIQSLKSSDPQSLVGLFGISGSTDGIVNAIVNGVTDSIEVKLKPYSKNLKGGLEINIQPSNFSNLLSLPQGHTVYKNGDLHWLDWLLIRGDTIIIADYQYTPGVGLGRSKLGNMSSGGSFRIPPQFSGTRDDNFVTRALIGQDQADAITRILNRVLS